MNPSSEVGKASGEETGIGETMEAVVTTLDAMTSAVDAMEAMMMVVEMRGWLEVGRAEMERTVAVNFFSRALAFKEEWSSDEERISHKAQIRPLYWPGRLPGLIHLLADCLLPHNSKAIQSDAMLSLKHIVCLDQPPRTEPINELFNESHVSEHLFRLGRESDCTEIRDQALWMLGRMTRLWYNLSSATKYLPEIPALLPWNLDFLPLITDLIRKNAAIQDPTDADLASLKNAIQALIEVADRLQDMETVHPQMLEILPVFIGIFQEPGKRKSAQIQAGEFLALVVPHLDGNSLLESGVMEMLLEMLRVGKETNAVLIKALRVLSACTWTVYHNQNIAGVKQKVLDMGILGVIHQVLKRPNDSFKRESSWDWALECLLNIQERYSYPPAAQNEAILSEEGLVELVLDMALGMDWSTETESFHRLTSNIHTWLAAHSFSTGQMRRLVFKGPIFPLLNRYLCLHYHVNLLWTLDTVRAFLLGLGSETERGLVRRLMDSSGITDTLRSISYAPANESYFYEDFNVIARNILDTYFNNPLPPPPPNKLPTIIYTRNAP